MPTKVVLSPCRVFPLLLRPCCFVCTGFGHSMKYLVSCTHPPARAARPGTAKQEEELSVCSALPGSGSARVPEQWWGCACWPCCSGTQPWGELVLWAAQVSPEDSGAVGMAGAGQCELRLGFLGTEGLAGLCHPTAQDRAAGGRKAPSAQS